MTECVKIKCDKCRHALKCPAKAEYGGAKRCSAFKPQEQTNEEWLRSATTKEIAECITDIVYECREEDDCMDCKIGCWKNVGYVLKWLKEKHK